MVKTLCAVFLTSLSIQGAEIVIRWDSSARYVDRLETPKRVEIRDWIVYDWLPSPLVPRLVGDRCEVVFSPTQLTGSFRVHRRWAPGLTQRLSWDASPAPGVTEYVVYGRTSVEQYEVARVPANQLSVVIRLEVETEVFIVVAVAEGEESERSNQVLTPDPPIPTNVTLKVKSAEPVSGPGGAIPYDSVNLRPEQAAQRRQSDPSQP